MKNNWKNMDTIECNLTTLIENVRKYLDKYKYNTYFVTEGYVLITKEKLTIHEINVKRCELKGEDHHYYW